MKVLVTGGGGFIGKALIKSLLANHYVVHNFSRKAYPELETWGVRNHIGSVSDYKAVLKASQGVDIIFHVAAKAGVWGNYNDFYKTNVIGTKNIIEACQENSIDKLVFTSSASVVFDGHDICGGNETLPYPTKSLSHYTSTKAIAEQIVLAANSSKLKTIALRPHIVWGPGDNHIIPGLLKRARNNSLLLIEDGNYKIDATYIDNVIEAHLKAIDYLTDKSKSGGKAFFISNDETITIRNFFNKILEAHNLPPVSKSIPKSIAFVLATALESFYNLFRINSEPRTTRFLVHEMSSHHWFDISEAKTELGYQPKISINEGFDILKEFQHTH